MWKIDKCNKKIYLLIWMAQSCFCNHMNLCLFQIVEPY